MILFAVNLFASEEQWEGFIDEPRRPLFIQVDFRPANNGREGSIRFPGTDAIPFSSINMEDSKLKLHLEFRGSSLNFTGEKQGDEIKGSVTGERTLPFWLQKIGPLPKPANRKEAWSQDLDAAVDRFLRYDRSFQPETAAKFKERIDELQSSLDGKSDAEVMVALSSAVALSGNAHTRLYLLRNRTELRRFPVRLWWFEDGLYIVRATSEYKKMIGCKVVAIAGEDVNEIQPKVTALFAGNESWKKYKSVYFLTSPEILSGIGLVKNMEQVEFALQCGRNSTKQLLRPLPLQKTDKPVEAWWDLAGYNKPSAGEWINALPSNVPLYLKHPDRHYWFETLRDGTVVFFQYNRSQNMPDESFADFANRLNATLTNPSVQRLIIDLRFNTGGNLDIAGEFFRNLANQKNINQNGKLFVITGRATFSAGISHAVQLKQLTSAKFFGEPVGDVLDFWSEGGNIVLPNSKLTLHFANGYHNYSLTDPEEKQPFFLDLDVPDVRPDVAVSLTFEDYRNGRDPALDAILELQ